MVHIDVRIFPDLETLSKAAAQEFARLAQASIAARGEFRVVLTGGSTVATLYEELSRSPYRENLAWSQMLFFWGDERLVPPDHPESNYAQAHRLLLSRVPVETSKIHRMRGELEPRAAIEAYLDPLKSLTPGKGELPRFDLVLLGLGADGHIASIFPGSEIDEGNRLLVMSTTGHYAGRPAQRLTLTPLAFNQAREILFLVAGENKAHAVREVFNEGSDARDWPALRIKPVDGRVTWMLDQAATEGLPDPIRNQVRRE